MIKKILLELNNKYFITISVIILITSAIITYLCVPNIIQDAINQKREYVKKNHLGYYQINHENQYLFRT